MNRESEIKKSPRQASAGSLINSPNKEGGRENVDKRRSESAKRRTNEEEKEDKLGDTPKISEVFASLDASSHGECIKIIENIDELEEENINSRNIVAPTPLILEKKHRDIIEDRELSEGISLTGDILSNVATIGSIEETQSKTKEAEEVLQSIVEAQKEEEEWGRKKTQEQNEGEGQGDLYYYPGYGGYPPEEDKGERGNIFQDGHHAPFTYLHHQGHDHLHQLSPDDHIPFKDNSPGMKGHTQINTISSTQLHQIIPTVIYYIYIIRLRIKHGLRKNELFYSLELPLQF